MGSYWKDKENYERKKREEETNQAILKFILVVVGGILTFILSKLLAPIVSKYPVASVVVFLAIGIGCYFYFANDKESSKETKVENFEAFANKFSQDENFCKQRLSKIVEAEGYKKKSYKATELSAKKIMASIISNEPQNYTGDDVENELCHGKFSNVSEDKYAYQLIKMSDNSLIKLYEFTLEKTEWYLTKIQKGGNAIETISDNDSATNIPNSSNDSETDYIHVEGFNIYIPKDFVEHPKMINTYVLPDISGGDSMYFSYEVLSDPKGPWDLNPDACEADYVGSENELHVSRKGEENEYSSIWREYKKNGKWCVLSVDYVDDDKSSDIWEFLDKSN